MGCIAGVYPSGERMELGLFRRIERRADDPVGIHGGIQQAKSRLVSAEGQ